jgi:biotin operon repressor
MICQHWAAVINSISRLLQLVSSVFIMVQYTLEQHVFLYDTYVKYRSARKGRWKFLPKFHDERVPSRQTIHNLVTKLRSAGLLIDKKQKHKCWVLPEEKLDDTEARFEHTSRKSLKFLAQETGVSKSNVRRATQLLKLGSYKTTVIHALQPCDPASRVHFCSWFLQSLVEGEVDQQLTDSIFNTSCDLWIVTTSFWMLLANRHIESLSKFICTSQLAGHLSLWSAEPWTSQQR